jgi:hypothetical protein
MVPNPWANKTLGCHIPSKISSKAKQCCCEMARFKNSRARSRQRSLEKRFDGEPQGRVSPSTFARGLPIRSFEIGAPQSRRQKIDRA